MGSLGHGKLAERLGRLWRGLVIHLAVAFLVVSLAGRYLRTSSGEVPTVQCSSPSAKIQHRAADASVWTVPMARALPGVADSSSALAIVEDEPPLTLDVNGRLGDRAPPVSWAEARSPLAQIDRLLLARSIVARIAQGRRRRAEINKVPICRRHL